MFMPVNYSIASGNDDLDIEVGFSTGTDVTSSIYNITTVYVTSPLTGLQRLEHDANLITEFYIKPVIYGIGIPGNILSLILWLQPRLRNSSGCYFAALSISDTVVLILHMISTLEKAGCTSFLVTTFSCEMFNVMYVSSECLSLMFVLGLTIDRFIIVRYPMKRHRLCTVSRTLRILAMQTFLALLMGIIEGSFWTYSRSHHRCESISLIGHNVFMEVGNMIIMTFGVVIPVILVIIFNIVIIITVQKLNKHRRVLCHISSRSMTADMDATIMLLSICCYVILAEVPDEIAYLIQPFYPEGNMNVPSQLREMDPTWRRHYKFNITACILSTFSLTNYAIDIFIYSLTGRRFREMFLVLLHCKLFDKESWHSFHRADSITWTFKAAARANHDEAHDVPLRHSPNPGNHNTPCVKNGEAVFPLVTETYV